MFGKEKKQNTPEKQAFSFVQYTGAKTIKAVPLNRKAAEAHLRRILKDDMNDEPGYLVEYEDGYQSWLPAATFEKAHRMSGTSLQCLQIETDDLRDRIKKISDFQLTPEYQDMTPKESFMLNRQRDVMLLYLNALYIRINYYKPQL